MDNNTIDFAPKTSSIKPQTGTHNVPRIPKLVGMVIFAQEWANVSYELEKRKPGEHPYKK
jgi:hypothetical protein